MRETKTTTLTFFVSISVLLEWLERQGKRGWYLEEIRGDGLTARFRRGEPGPVRCRAVPAQEKTLDRDTIEEYADFGWTYLGRFRELYHVFSTRDSAAREIYTDRESLPENFRRAFRRKAVGPALLLALGLLNAVLRLTPVFMGWPRFVRMDRLSADFLLGLVWLLITAFWTWRYGSAWWYSRRQRRSPRPWRYWLGRALPALYMAAALALCVTALWSSAGGGDRALVEEGPPDQWAEPLAWLPAEGETEAGGWRYAYPLAPTYARITSKAEDMDLWVYTTWYRLRWPWLAERVAADLREDCEGELLRDSRVENIWFGTENFHGNRNDFWLLWGGDRVLMVSGQEGVDLAALEEEVVALWLTQGEE